MIDRFEQFSLAIFNISRYWNKIAAEEMKKYGLKGAYAITLVTIYRCDGDVTASRLCELCSKDKAEISRTIAAMEEKGFLKREGKNFYRANLILTEAGKNAAQDISSKATLAVELTEKGVSDEKRDVFFEVLGIMSNNLKEISREGLPEQ
ncbi:MAG: MarR family transcriptional regulator [Lachnospiraceae bacterium]|nr:MarR family transcriptional regulator [Lachnospiraceae bacterium]